VHERQAKFPLCGLCSRRQAAQTEFPPADGEGCFICRGLSGDLEKSSAKVVPHLARFEFRTFSIGLVLPQGVQEREDSLRSELRIRGGETVKSDFSNRLSSMIARRTRKRLDKAHPDVTVLINLGTDTVETASRPAFIRARYTKPRGIAQRRSFCEKCGGKGCDGCGGTGYSSLPSVEGLVSKKLGSLLGAKKFKFTWYGSEDTESAVYPPGRPFVVEAKNPMRRSVPSQLRLRTGKGGMSVLGMRATQARLGTPAFTFKTRVLMLAERPIEAAEVKKLQKEMRNAMVQYRNNKGRVVHKKVYSVRATARGKKITADVKLDGGLPVKRLVSGESVSPSFSESLRTQLRCERFDIVHVWPKRAPLA
jgi:tRNA pseudouridine synthase 10